MAPIAVTPPPPPETTAAPRGNGKVLETKLPLQVKGIGHLNKEQDAGAADYDHEAEEAAAGANRHYLPTWEDDRALPPLAPFEYVERGLSANRTFPNLLGGKDARTEDLTPTTGTEVRGVQLSGLSTAGKDEMALLAAQRKVLVFRDQDFADLDVGDAVDFCRHFGRLHVHPTSGAAAGFPEALIVYRGAGDTVAQQILAEHNSTIVWHSDLTFEAQPPGVTFLYVLDQPRTGGDTIFANTVEAYNRLSPAMQQRLHGLEAVHSGKEQADAARARGSIVRREPVDSVHPIVRTHPATGEKALFVNPQFTRSIVGLKHEESELLLRFLFQHIASGADFHARVNWQANSVVIWDNRVTTHSAILDFFDDQRRHLVRITPQAEIPYQTPYE